MGVAVVLPVVHRQGVRLLQAPWQCPELKPAAGRLDGTQIRNLQPRCHRYRAGNHIAEVVQNPVLLQHPGQAGNGRPADEPRSSGRAGARIAGRIQKNAGADFSQLACLNRFTNPALEGAGMGSGLVLQQQGWGHQGWGQVLFCSRDGVRSCFAALPHRAGMGSGLVLQHCRRLHCPSDRLAHPNDACAIGSDSEQCPLTPDGPAREMLQYKTWPPARALSYGEDSGFSRTLSSLQCRHWPAHNPCIAGLARALMRGGVTVSLAHSFLKLRSHHERVHPG